MRRETKKSRPRPATLLKKESLAQMFSCEFCEISKNTIFTEHLHTTAFKTSYMSNDSKMSRNSWPQQTLHMYSMLKRRGNGRFYIVLT